jgi:serine/threonine protein kinase
MDLNGDGVIDRNEMAAVLQKVNPKVFSEDALKVLFKAADLDGDGFIHYAEFVSWICKEQDSGLTSAVLGASVTTSTEASSGGADLQPSPPAQKIEVKTQKPKGRRESSEKQRMVMGRYMMGMTDDDFMGEGTSSICRKGIDTQTGKVVAVKVYKDKVDQTTLIKFRRQIEVLEQLMRPFERPSDPRLWCETLEKASPEKVFMQLLDYSKGRDGKPGPDPQDKKIYVVTELAQYSMKDYIKSRKEEGRPMSRETVRVLVRNIMLVVAGLHAKGLVHLDLKPENLMVFDGVLKLIDVDGCIKIGTTVSIDDESLSFSPVYCSPEWAHFLIDDEHEEPTIRADAGLDVWSIGMTLLELVTLDPVLKPQYASFFRNGRERDEASYMFFEWLSSLKRPVVPRKIRELDQKLHDLLADNLLVTKLEKRKTLAETLSHPFVSGADLRRSSTGPLVEDACGNRASALPGQAEHKGKGNRVEDTSEQWVMQGTLWKLNSGADAKDPVQWLQRDIWIANTGSFCYWSKKDSKRLQLMDSHVLQSATVSRVECGAKEHAFKVSSPEQTIVFGCDSKEECDKWSQALEKAKCDAARTVKMGAGMAKEIRKFRMQVRNRRQALDANMKAGESFKPQFKAFLWKLKTEGDPQREGDWFRREMWLSKNGSFVYWSEKEERELVYYTAPDIAHATITTVETDESPKSWRFQIKLAAIKGMEFSPGEFAADSKEDLDRWLKELARFNF